MYITLLPFDKVWKIIKVALLHSYWQAYDWGHSVVLFLVNAVILITMLLIFADQSTPSELLHSKKHLEFLLTEFQETEELFLKTDFSKFQLTVHNQRKLTKYETCAKCYHWKVHRFHILYIKQNHAWIQRGGGGLNPPEKSQNVGFTSKTGADPWKIAKLPSQHSMLGHLQHAS